MRHTLHGLLSPSPLSLHPPPPGGGGGGVSQGPRNKGPEGGSPAPSEPPSAAGQTAAADRPTQSQTREVKVKTKITSAPHNLALRQAEPVRLGAGGGGGVGGGGGWRRKRQALFS